MFLSINRPNRHKRSQTLYQSVPHFSSQLIINHLVRSSFQPGPDLHQLQTFTSVDTSNIRSQLPSSQQISIMYSHNRKNSRIQHLASLGWILEDKPTTKSPAHNYNQSLPYSHAVQQSTPPQSPVQENNKDQARYRALSVADVPKSDRN